MIETTRGILADTRTNGPLPTPREGFSIDLERLDRLAAELAADDGWSVDLEVQPPELRR